MKKTKKKLRYMYVVCIGTDVDQRITNEKKKIKKIEIFNREEAKVEKKTIKY